jgi:hypothetical protein
MPTGAGRDETTSDETTGDETTGDEIRRPAANR